MQKSEEKLHAELFFDLKSAKKKKRLDWITIADKCAEAVRMYGSPERAADKFDVSPSLMRSILSLRKLDSRVQEMVRNGDILFDSAQRLNTIKEKERQYEVAKLLVDVSNKKQREIIQHAKSFPTSDLIDYRSRVLGESVKKERLRVLIMPLPEELYQSLDKASKEEGKPIEKILPELIANWLTQRGKSKRH